MKDKIQVIIGIFLLAIIFLVGWLANDIYENYKNQRVLDGLLLRNFNYSNVEDTTSKIDEKGDWICVDVRGMSYERAVKVCSHEVGHEIFAEECEKNMTKCLEVFKE